MVTHSCGCCGDDPYHPTLLIPPQIARQILEAHTSMLSLTVADAKLQYIRNWQALQDFGITYFVVKVGRNKKEVSLWHIHYGRRSRSGWSGFGQTTFLPH